MAAIDQRQQRDLAAVSGALFVALFGLGFVISNLVTSTWYPSPYDSAAEIERYFTEHRTEERALSLVHALAAIALLIFSAYVAAFVRRSAEGAGALPWLALAGGTLSSALLLLSALSTWMLSRPHMVEDASARRLFHDFTYATGGPAHVLAFAPFVGAASAAALRTRSLPEWLARIGIVTAGLSLVSALALVTEPASYILPIARAVTFFWITVVSLLLVRGELGTAGG